MNPFKVLTVCGLVSGMIGTVILVLPSLKSRFRNDNGEGAPLGPLPKPFEYSDNKMNLYCTRSGLGLIGLGFLSQLIAILNQP